MAAKKDSYIQAVRGLAIAAVVLIHCLPQEAASVALRPALNFSVATFVFLSGYLTPRERAEDAGAFVHRRVGKILVPYIAWTAFYLVVRGVLAPRAVLTAFIVGGSAQLYYLIVYLQLVLLTPWLFRLLDRSAARVALYAITPVTLVVRYALSVASVSLPIQAFCGSWLLFYLLGLEWRDRVEPWLRGHRVSARHALLALVACLLLQEAEGFSWLAAGNYDLATTQLKFTSMLTSVCFVSLVALASQGVRRALSECAPLVFLGDLSFGIYLCHMAPIMVWGKLVPWDGILPALAEWVFVIAVSVLVILAVRRVLPQKAVRALGFE